MISILIWLLFQLDTYLGNITPDETEQNFKFSNEVIVKGLSFDANENDISNYFDQKCGQVSKVKLLMNSQGRSKGIAFVSFETEEGYNKALEMNNSEFMGRYLIIEKTKSKAERLTQMHSYADQGPKIVIVDNISSKINKFDNEVIVKGLSFDADENDIGNYLNENCGSVTRVNLLKNEQGCSKGVAFVSFETEEGCNKAVELSDSEFMGRQIFIEKTKPKIERPAQLPADQDSKTIFVGNLSFVTNKETLKKFFASCGKVVNARIAEAEGKSRGFGHVEFEERSGVENALKMAGEQIDGRPIRVDVAASRGKLVGFNRIQ
ncbi:hypothetical protein TTHERM_00384810 (macronuclear) [Tetrahymena thermophila SB210]|uniref:RRM domain-containing protein n=1 Tax=Tetrahymena thermophila (strain SB210) TaxID=312017 RepID=Q23RL1_TETTS|nr:hypothetical protein TTHERM_00384810 [Tetrahymena thermophila SB210]EAR99037.1 hypothetical protein TTHERM_00384810 [Tetrahymena thermophila SB210]|eukprot:XP_001019282.1 hypothetical protein TTHERM_00384810 [Tetrahymena thermophila SB210]